jgi:hypothetical protein
VIDVYVAGCISDFQGGPPLGSPALRGRDNGAAAT